MIITVRNNVNGLQMQFLDQQEIRRKYNKITLSSIDFLNNRDLNLLSDIGGNGGIYGLPENDTQGYSKPFSQRYNSLDNKYGQRTIEFSAYIPALLLLREQNIYDYINEVLYQDGTTLFMEFDLRNDGGRLTYLPTVGCQKQPLSNSSFQFTFIVWGDSSHSFVSPQEVATLSLVNLSENLIYPHTYPFVYDISQANNIIEIDNPTSIPLDIAIRFDGGIGIDPTVENLINGNIVGWSGGLNIGDRVIIRSSTSSITFNGNNNLINKIGDFFELQPGINRLKFDVTNSDPINPPICYITYTFRYTNV